MSERMQQLTGWLDSELNNARYDIRAASEDASFRRYFRVSLADRTYIVMDAPPDKEDCGPFLDVSTRLQACGLNVPEVHAKNLEQGFILLGDLGSELYLDHLSEENVDTLYGEAMAALLQIQTAADAAGLPPYDEALLMQEMSLFDEWLLGEHLQLALTEADRLQLQAVFRLLCDSALAQPRVFVHRDYHSRNLMLHEPRPGIIDYQDAVLGPLTYDLVSLLKDCYIKWPAEKTAKWLENFHQQCVASTITDVSLEAFRSWFDLMGVQRHLKASGIFARLCHRDGKPGFLNDIPRTLSYILELEGRYQGLDPLIGLLQQKVMPGLEQK